ncbi:MAG: helix-turn-helix domain-containing protein [Verrucomicrobiae bacterium]|nr:helix-turn-helix domain-containing protein [Verrucomicrobiae bacterium]
MALRRAVKGWSQMMLSNRSGVPRTTISAIEGDKLAPSVATALALARALECSVEELFGGVDRETSSSLSHWAWMPRGESSRYWEAEVSGRRLLYPVEGLFLNAISHDGVWQSGVERGTKNVLAENTLVMACCDPAAGLLASEYARVSGFRLIIFSRGGSEALDLLKRGLVHVAGLHRSTQEQPDRNEETVRDRLGDNFQLVRAVQWQEGLVLGAENHVRSARSAVKQARRWALREKGSAARECLDELFDGKSVSGRTVRSHSAVVEAVRGGWADAGVCVQLGAEEAGLNFLPVRMEFLDFCFENSLARDARVLALIRLLRSRDYRGLISELPGYDARLTGEFIN